MTRLQRHAVAAANVFDGESFGDRKRFVEGLKLGFMIA